jgi:methionine-S-sulfoxide reductase
MKMFFLTLILGAAIMPNASAGNEPSQAKPADLKTATFAGGCFWCMQPPYDQLPGVVSTTVGYTGGFKPYPTYEEVSSGQTGHLEAVRIVYDPAKVDYNDLLRIFWQSIDPTDPGGQFADQGSQYHTAIFYHDEEQRKLAEASKAELAASGRFKKPIVVPILLAKPFYPAEDHHQKYYRKSTIHYKMYKAGSGREGFLNQTWGRKE